ncbi:YolD-like family protein [Paenibacillus sp. B2(2019)]|uniref:YolD-like family protein n=1 Tax=Paenibacillus sp. B2(2019) TaxID=2607754 RepID=UPI0011F0E7F1|nr:YolD-like family protein [Paenibacillus sp. B2(2019)]KAA1180721.1 YolD-like family protein [Paenibacillus sp. B2(2019)]
MRRFKKVRTRSELDLQALDEIQQVLVQSMEDHSPITLNLFDPIDDKEIRGIVMRLDQRSRQLKLRTSDDDWEWINIEDVIHVTT